MADTHEPLTDPENILDDVEYTLHQASTGVRFSNYLIDRVSFYLIWRFGLIKFTVTVIYMLKVPLDSRWAVFLVSYILAATTFVLYVGAFESLTGGKTLGKFITGTRAINDDGTRVTPATAMLRSLSRLVPFEAFSALGGSPPYPWHDRWTKTCVIDERLSTLPPAE